MSGEMEDDLDLSNFIPPMNKRNMEGITYGGVTRKNQNEADTSVDSFNNFVDDDLDVNIPNVDVKTRSNEGVPWKKRFHALGMRFTNPKQLKHMLCNYDIVNGYQLCYKKW
ncbi:unnamed protein product [Lactuca saligna]|uniref:Uncharacterized protein n=1 Tax=Lactuca saligna TaxID=75948 RepID=A0AA35ZVE4_LACSI|nr:unnamed protein product [Lactuca saligna]